jgi:hypothetical protein
MKTMRHEHSLEHSPEHITRCALRILCCCWVCVAAGMVAGGGGCNSAGTQSSAAAAGREREAVQQADARAIQSDTMSFADRYTTAIADVYDQAQRNAKTPEARLTAQRYKILTALGAFGNAVDPNPLLGLMDMALMVTLAREVAADPWATELFGPDDAAAIQAALKTQEADIWNVAASHLSPDQIKELHQLAERWRREHPEQRYVSSARLTDFPESKSATGGGGRAGGGGGGLVGAGANLAGGVANSVFGIVKLDPFTGLDPAVRQVEESRLLAERMFYYFQRAPQLLSWQIDALYYQMLAQPEVKKLLDDTTTVAGSTTRFTDSTNKFAAVSGQFADTIEKFRVQLPQQQSTLVEQLNGLIATQRSAALNQATTQVSAQSDAMIKQLNSSISSQQGAMTRNLQVVTDSSIDRLYQRARSLVLITVASILAAFVIYRVLVAARPRNDRHVLAMRDPAREREPIQTARAESYERGKPS